MSAINIYPDTQELSVQQAISYQLRKSKLLILLNLFLKAVIAIKSNSELSSENTVKFGVTLSAVVFLDAVNFISNALADLSRMLSSEGDNPSRVIHPQNHPSDLLNAALFVINFHNSKIEKKRKPLSSLDVEDLPNIKRSKKAFGKENLTDIHNIYG